MTIKDTAERQWDRKNAWARKESLISMEGMALANLNIGWFDQQQPGRPVRGQS